MTRFKQTQELKRKRVVSLDRGETGKEEEGVEMDKDDRQEFDREDRHELDEEDGPEIDRGDEEVLGRDDGHELDGEEEGQGLGRSCGNASCEATMKRLNEECIRLQTEIWKLKGQVNSLSFNQESLKDKDDKVHKLTVLPSYVKLIVVFSFISSFLKLKSCLSTFQQFLLTLMCLRMNLPLFFLAHVFHVSTSTAGRVFNNTLNVMNIRLCNIIKWPSRDQILCYRNCFENCTSIIDCFEIFIERPKERARAQTYSQYKHHNTVKYLISITPQGVISFVSKGWGGRTSDKHVTENSGFLEMLSLQTEGLMWQTLWVLLMLDSRYRQY